MKNILLLSPFFYPEPISTGKFNTVIAKEISKEVDTFDVLCAHPIYPKWQVELTDEQLEGVNALRGGKWLKFPKNVLLRRAVLELWYFIYVFKKLLFSKKQYSHVVAVFPPSLFMLLAPLLVKKAKMVGIVHDLQSIYAKRDAGFLRKLLSSAIKLVESRTFKNCEQLIFLSENMKNVAKDEYRLNDSKCVVHYPIVTISHFVNNNKLTHLIPDESISIVYSGALGEKQAPIKLAQFMDALVKSNPQIKPYIFSQGPEFERLKNEYPSIAYHPLVEEECLPELLMRSSIQILPQETGTSDGSLPSKLPNLLASKCKILCVTDKGSELVRILDSFSRARVTHDWDENNLICLTEKLLVETPQDADDRLLLDMFSKDALVKRILEEN